MIAYLTQQHNEENVNLPENCPWVSWVHNPDSSVPQNAIIVTDEQFAILYASFESLILAEQELIKQNANITKIDANLIPISITFSKDHSYACSIKNTRVHNTKHTTSGSSLIIYATKDGTEQGIPLFNNLEDSAIQLSVRSSKIANNEFPSVSIESIVGNKITLKIKKSNSGIIFLGGTYSGVLDNDLPVIIYTQITGLTA